jgi:regulator of sigma E protease
MLLTILVFLITLSVLIIFHELGHFLVAKKAGIKVEEFGLGYPPRIWAKKIGRTVYSLNWIPLGGFVKLFGQDEIEKKKKGGAFWAKSKRVRMAVIWAGVLANLCLAFFLFTIIYSAEGIPTPVQKVEIIGVAPDSAAQEAGLKEGDLIVSVDGQPVENLLGSEADLDRFIGLMEEKRGNQIKLVVKREEEADLVFLVTPRQDPPEGEGPLGVAISNIEMKKYPFWQMPVRAAVEGAKETYFWTRLVVGGLIEMLRKLIFIGQVPEDIAGPIGILQVTSHVAQAGVITIFQFIAILSVNLAVINIFPFPALDGGRFLFLIFETITGRRSHEQIERWVHNIGMAFLLFLMLLVTINDIKRVLTTTEFGLRLKALWPF